MILTTTGDSLIAKDVVAFLQHYFAALAADIKVFQEGKLCFCVVYEGFNPEQWQDVLSSSADLVKEVLEWNVAR